MIPGERFTICKLCIPKLLIFPVPLNSLHNIIEHNLKNTYYNEELMSTRIRENRKDKLTIFPKPPYGFVRIETECQEFV
jgi:hypothetical protein